jgi:hypothetical protein
MTKRKYSGLVAPSGLPKDLADAFAKLDPWSAQGDTVGERSAPDPNAHQRRSASKAAMRRSVDECRADCVLVAPSGLSTVPCDHPSGWQVDVDEQSAHVHQKWLASKAAYRRRRSADDAFREKERKRARDWRRNNPAKIRNQKAKSRAANYHRPFVAIDSEGQDYPNDGISYQGVHYPRHDTYLWGAAADDGRAPAWLTAVETHGMDKRPLSAVEILDWLLDLRRQYRKAVFIMFSFKYDIAQILKRFGYFTVNPKTVLDFGRYLGKSLFYIIGLNPSTRLGVAIGNKTIYFANVILRVGL